MFIKKTNSVKGFIFRHNNICIVKSLVFSFLFAVIVVAGAAADSRVKLQLGEQPFPVDVGDDLEPCYSQVLILR